MQYSVRKYVSPPPHTHTHTRVHTYIYAYVSALKLVVYPVLVRFILEIYYNDKLR
jgi:hypothetical protein